MNRYISGDLEYYIGKKVEIKWVDPCSEEDVEAGGGPSGMEALPVWTEYGVVENLKEGVLKIKYSETWYGDDEDSDCFYGWIPVCLITHIEELCSIKERDEKESFKESPRF